MKVLIFGASGRTGRCLVEQALAAGHEVSAFVRDPTRAPAWPKGLRVIVGDATHAAAVDAAVAGHDAVLSALGQGRDGRAPLAEATGHIVAAMERHNVRRLVCLSAQGVGESARASGLVFNLIVRPILHKSFDEKERMEQVVRSSRLDWVVVRACRLTNGPARGRYRLDPDHFGPTSAISRADTAACMVAQLTSDRYVGRTPALAF
jgi:putative NADH-flavin reductase